MRRARKVQRRRGRKDKRQRRQRRGNQRKTWLDSVRDFFTSHFWRVAHKSAGPYRAVRWQLMALVIVCIIAMFCPAKAEKDRVEEARDYYVAMYPHRKRPGKTEEGFLAALARLPRYFFKGVQPIVRQRVAAKVPGWYVDGWIPFGVDGSRLALPRYAVLERRFGTAGTGDFPHLWVTSLVHLSSGVPWAWRFGRSDASERHQFCHLLPTLPPRALVMADAGYVGYEVWETLLQQGRHFVMRLGSNVQLYADYEVRADFAEGQVYLWPITKPHKKPLALRLVRLPAQGKCVNDVWLATNTSATELNRDTISKMFRLRWEHEVFYRTYKCTLQKAKLSSRTVKQVTREAEMAMLAVQLFLAQAACAVGRKDATQTASCAETLRQLRRDWRYLLKHGRLQQRFLERLAKAGREHRASRTSPKNYREWPRKRQHRAPEPPRIALFPPELKARLTKELAHGFDQTN